MAAGAGVEIGVGPVKELVLVGSVAKNVGIKKVLEEALGMDILVPEEPQIIGALGAALFASDE